MMTMANPIPKISDIIYATLIKETQVALDSQEFSVPFKKRTKEDRVTIKKKILAELKKYSEEVAKKIQEKNALKGDSKEIAVKLREIIQRCVNEY